MKLFSKPLITSVLLTATFIANAANAANVAYIHGRVAANGTVLNEGEGNAYDPMLLSDTGSRGTSKFKQLVEDQGHTISSYRDKDTTLSAAFLANLDVIVFSLHQKIWSGAEKVALDNWLNAGGGMLIYSDSASGGFHREVGAQNPVGQGVTNNLIGQYGMQVTVDQANGVPQETASSTASIVGLRGNVLKGEGVSPVAIAPNDSSVEILIPFTFKPVNRREGLTIQNPVFASLALKPVGQGHITVMFDRQPMWNRGPGADIDDRDNTNILKSVINFMAERPAVTPPSPPNPPSDLTVTPVLSLLLDD